MTISALAAMLLMAARAAPLSAQVITSDTMSPRARADSGAIAPLTALPPEPPPLIRERDWSGPRIGLTFGTGSAQRGMEDNGLGAVVSQFGWHFEHQVVPLGGGPQLITEVVPLLGGAEYGKLLPSVTVAIGIRTKEGFEFGMGPSLTLMNSAGRSGMGLVIAVGQSIDYSGISIPLDLALSTNPDGTRTTLTVGYAIRRSSR
jgi:hypothetical protein